MKLKCRKALKMKSSKKEEQLLLMIPNHESFK